MCNTYNCSGLYKCVLSTIKVCLHPVSICDSIEDCHSGEDEHFCDLSNPCPASCSCLLYGIFCSQKFHLADTIKHFKICQLIHIVKTAFQQEVMQSLPHNHNAVVLIWSQSWLTDVCGEENIIPPFTQYLSLSFNHIKIVKKDCFMSSLLVKILSVSNNEIYLIAEQAFAGLDLTFVDLSQNPLVISGKGFESLRAETLKLVGYAESEIRSDIGRKMRVDIVLTDDFRLCCLVKSVDTICSTLPTWPDSCNVLLKTTSAQTVTLTEAILIAILNLAALMFNFIQITKMRNEPQNQERRKKNVLISFIVTVVCVNMNDMLFGYYLIFLFATDQYYGSTYVSDRYQWLGGMPCKILGVLSIFAMLNSFFLLNLITIARFVSVKYPFSHHFKSLTILKRYLLTGFPVNFVIAALSLCSYQVLEGYFSMPSATCLFLGETNQSLTVKSATAFVCFLEVGSFVSVVIFYTSMFRNLGESKLTMNKNQKREQSMLVQALLVATSNALCWLPSCAIYILSIVSETYPTDLLIWNAILINPLNSVLNPGIFTLVPIVKGKCS